MSLIKDMPYEGMMSKTEYACIQQCILLSLACYCPKWNKICSQFSFVLEKSFGGYLHVGFKEMLDGARVARARYLSMYNTKQSK